MASPLKSYLDRSFGMLRKNTARVMRMDAAPNQPPLPIFSFTAQHPPVDPPTDFALGCDADIGGLSTAALTPVAGSSAEASSSGSGGQSHMAFHGNLSLQVPPAYQGRIRTGYAAFRNKTRPTLFGEETWDLGLYSHLRVVVGYRGWDGWRSRWVVNIQTDGPVRSDLFQHRLPLPASPSSGPDVTALDPSSPDPPVHFSTLHLPLTGFVLTNSGQTSATQIPMLRQRVRTVGFGLLGGGRDGTPPPSVNVTEELKRVGAGGWSRGSAGQGEVELDRELEELIASDQPQAVLGQQQQQQPTQTSGGYHRVGASQSGSSVSTPAHEAEVDEVTGGTEGYYELCVRSVEAVKWDPEADEDE